MLYRFVVILLFSTSFFSCEKVDEAVSSSKQIERIESYLSKRSEPFTIDNDVYRVKTNVVVNNGNVLAMGDSIYINYAQYVFKTAPDMLFNTNIMTLAVGGGIHNSLVVYEPLGLVYGESKIIPGLNIGLKNSIVGDSLMLYITSDNAYKNKTNGVVPKNSTITMFVSIEKIVKK